MIVKLAVGHDDVAVDLRGMRVRPLQSSAPRGARDPERLVARAVDFPLAGDSLTGLAATARSAVVVVPDATRNVNLPKVLPVVLARLLAAAIPAHRIQVVLACGTHPPVPDEALARLVGKLPTGVMVRQHNARSEADLTPIGELRPGLPLRIDSAAASTDLLVTIGGVKHHYFAGFGGGPKMVFPGIAGYDEVQANHSRVLRVSDGRVERHPCCEPGVLDGNPVAEEIADAADLRPPDMAICLAPGRDGGVAAVFAGPWRKAFDAAVGQVREWFEIDRVGFDRLVGYGGGFPADSTLIQAHKGLDAICRFANPGAEIIFAARLNTGAGSPAMAPFLDDPTPESILSRLSERYVQYGHTALRIIEKTAKYRIYLASELDRDLAERLGFVPVDDLDAVADLWRARGLRDRVAVMSEAHVWPRIG